VDWLATLPLSVALPPPHALSTAAAATPLPIQASKDKVRISVPFANDRVDVGCEPLYRSIL
jgi:hypothetical protein